MANEITEFGGLKFYFILFLFLFFILSELIVKCTF
jgi:hypothetical protein